MNTIYWAADSTVQYNDILTYPQTGIGQVMNLYLKPEYLVSNHAKNGRSTKSFLDEGRFEPIQRNMGEGDFLFIQFGHNDEKENDPTRYTTPQGTYKDNLKLFIHAAKEVKAYPVLITPLERRLFDDENGGLKDSAHMEYVKAMKEVAEEEQVPLIDLTAKSTAKQLEAGQEETKNWFMHLPAGVYASCMEGKIDNTHLKYAGAVTFAGCIAEGLRELGGIYEELLLTAEE